MVVAFSVRFGTQVQLIKRFTRLTFRLFCDRTMVCWSWPSGL